MCITCDKLTNVAKGIKPDGISRQVDVFRHERPDRPIENNAICGNCGKTFIQHNFEDGTIFCNTFTTGDIFTDEPSSQILINFIEENYPKQYKRYIQKWKKLTHNA